MGNNFVAEFCCIPLGLSKNPPHNHYYRSHTQAKISFAEELKKWGKMSTVCLTSSFTDKISQVFFFHFQTLSPAWLVYTSISLFGDREGMATENTYMTTRIAFSVQNHYNIYRYLQIQVPQTMSRAKIEVVVS